MSPDTTSGRVFREAALRAHLAGTASATPDDAGPGRVLVSLWFAALVLVALAALVAV